MAKNTALVHSSASALSTAGVLPGQGPSSKVSTTSLSARKSSCLKCSKPKPGPPVVSTSTTRLTPSASGFAQGMAGGAARAAADTVGARPGGLPEIAPVTSTVSSDLADAASRSACAAGTVAGAAASSACGDDVQNHTA